MKKNLMSVIILALVFANFVLTAILMFSVLPQTKKANALIESVCTAISLDLNSGAATGTNNIPQEQIEDYALKGGEQLDAISFALGEDGKSHVLVCTVSLSLNNQSEGYEKYGADLSSVENQIRSEINKIVGKYTMDEFNSDKQSVYDEILSSLQDKFGSDYIVGINFISSLTQ